MGIEVLPQIILSNPYPSSTLNYENKITYLSPRIEVHKCILGFNKIVVCNRCHYNKMKCDGKTPCCECIHIKLEDDCIPHIKIRQPQRS